MNESRNHARLLNLEDANRDRQILPDELDASNYPPPIPRTRVEGSEELLDDLGRRRVEKMAELIDDSSIFDAITLKYLIGIDLKNNFPKTDQTGLPTKKEIYERAEKELAIPDLFKQRKLSKTQIEKIKSDIHNLIAIMSFEKMTEKPSKHRDLIIPNVKNEEPPPIPKSEPKKSTEEEWFDSPPNDDGTKQGDNILTRGFDRFGEILIPQGKKAIDDEKKLGSGGGGGGGTKPPKEKKGGFGKWLKRGLVALGIISGGAYMATRDSEENKLPPSLPTHTTTDTGSSEVEIEAQNKKFADAGLVDAGARAEREVVDDEEVVVNEPKIASQSKTFVEQKTAEPLKVVKTEKPQKKEPLSQSTSETKLAPKSNSEIYPIQPGDGLWVALKNTFPDKNNKSGIDQNAINLYWLPENQNILFLDKDLVHFNTDGKIDIERNGKMLKNKDLPRVTAETAPVKKLSPSGATAESTASSKNTTTVSGIENVNDVDSLELVEIANDAHGTDLRDRLNNELTPEKKQEVIKLLIIQNEQGSGKNASGILIENTASLIKNIKKEPVLWEIVDRNTKELDTKIAELEAELTKKLGAENSALITEGLRASKLYQLQQELKENTKRGTYKTGDKIYYLPDEFKATIIPGAKEEIKVEPLQSQIMKTLKTLTGLTGSTEKFQQKLDALNLKLNPLELAEKIASDTFDELNRQARIINKAEGRIGQKWPEVGTIQDPNSQKLFVKLKQAKDKAINIASYSAEENKWFKTNPQTMVDRDKESRDKGSIA